MIFGVYEVIGRRQYRGHEPGSTFEAVIAPAVEQRAVQRGDIRLLRRIRPSLVPGSYTLRGWPPPGRQTTPVAPQTEPPQGGSLIEGGG